MGMKLAQYFADAASIGGIEARVQLVRLTNISSVAAKTAEDDPETIKLFEEAMKSLKTEFKHSNVIRLDSRGSFNAISDQSISLNKTHASMQANKKHFIKDIEETARQVTEASSQALDIARVSVWFINSQKKAIECIDLYEKASGKHSSGLALYEKDYPAYFMALKVNRAINAHNANIDYRTSCFSDSYLKPLGITSMLDIPIWHGKEMKGVICNEHIGPTRTWTVDEADFGVGLANFITEALGNK